MRYSQIKSLKNKKGYALKIKNTGLLVTKDSYNLELILIGRNNSIQDFLPKTKTYLFIGDREFEDDEIKNIMIKINQYLEKHYENEGLKFITNNFTEIVYKTFAKLAYKNLGINSYKLLLQTINNYLLSYYERRIETIDTLPLIELKKRIKEVLKNNRLVFLPQKNKINFDSLASRIMKDILKEKSKIA